MVFDPKKHRISDSCSLLIKRLKEAVGEAKPTIDVNWSQSSDSLWPLLFSMLTYTLNIINIDKNMSRTAK